MSADISSHDKCHTGMVLKDLRRLRSHNGTPRFCLFFTNGMLLNTKGGAQINFLLENSEYLGIPLTVYLHRGRVVYVDIEKRDE